MPKRKVLRPVHVNIKRLREALGISQLDLAKASRVSKSMVSHWERGEAAPLAERLPLVARALGTTVDSLLS